MKSLEELAFGKTDLRDLLTHVILAEVEEAARARRFGRNLVRINEDLVRTKGRYLVFYTRGKLTAYEATEGVAPEEAEKSKITYTPTTLSVSKYAVATQVTQEAIDGSNLDLIRDSIREAGLELADKEDQVIVETLLGATEATDGVTLSAAGTWHFAHSPLLSIQDTSNIGTIDYYDGIAHFLTGTTLSAFTWTWSNRQVNSEGAYNFVVADTPGSFGYLDVVECANKIRGLKWSPDFMLIHPDQMADLLRSSQFVDFSKYGAREPLLRGEIGQISGLRVLVSTNMISGTALVLASKRAAWLAIKRHIDLKRWDNPSKDSIELFFYMEYGAAVTDEDAIALVVNMGSLAGDL